MSGGEAEALQGTWSFAMTEMPLNLCLHGLCLGNGGSGVWWGWNLGSMAQSRALLATAPHSLQLECLAALPGTLQSSDLLETSHLNVK